MLCFDMKCFPRESGSMRPYTAQDKMMMSSPGGPHPLCVEEQVTLEDCNTIDARIGTTGPSDPIQSIPKPSSVTDPIRSAVNARQQALPLRHAQSPIPT